MTKKAPHVWDKRLRPDGYYVIWVPGRGQVLEHRLIMERLLGRRLRRFEDVHHINGRRDDNSLENFKHIPHGEHGKMHAMDRWDTKRHEWP